MEATEAPSGGSPSRAKITGIQFGLMTTDDIVKMSVTENQEASRAMKPRDVMVDGKLGLPIPSGQCKTCNGVTVDQCQGEDPKLLHHEAKRKLSKKMQPMLTLRSPDYDDPEDSSTSNGINKRKRASSDASEVDVEDCPKVPKDLPKENDWSENVVILSSDDSDQELAGKGKQQFETTKDPGPSSSKASVFAQTGKTPGVSIPNGAANISASPRRSTRKRKLSGNSYEATLKLASKYDAAKDVEIISKSTYENSGKTGKNSNMSAATFPTPDKCKYCSSTAQNRGYPKPEINVHVSPRGRDKEDLLSSVKAIKMSVTPDGLEYLASDFWDFVEGSSKAENSNRRASRYLLPSEALKILRKIPEKRFADLGVKADVARPEAFVLECIPIPPNCLRLQEDGFGSSGTNIGFKLGVDRTTKALERLLRKINSIRTARFSKPVFQAALMECSVLQAYFQLYLREKGAPKAAAGPEK
ncbi:hypothetical protein R1flu_002331 [Riccia fluitans]|uniref:DNA-directed RNA polymerase n=1 Tax=Riccia fluitans TaxID=41844 RepID=A0ABD1Y667_9MARC